MTVEKMPALFVSHGAPTFALEPGLAGAQLNALGRALGRPAAIVIVSPHWTTRGVEISSSTHPSTVYDFGGFPEALYKLTYAAPGDPELALRIADLLTQAGIDSKLNSSQGFDHGVWVPLRYLYPDANVPVVQVSMPARLGSDEALALGRALAPLSEGGILVIGSGSLTHNLYEFRRGHADKAEYARDFTMWIREAVLTDDQERMRRALEVAPHADRAHPTPEHFLPLLVALGAAGRTLPATVLDGGIYHGVLAMESYVFGRDLRMESSAAPNGKTERPRTTPRDGFVTTGA
jgi:4,5-DOPA dioxygenase extradiol